MHQGNTLMLLLQKGRRLCLHFTRRKRNLLYPTRKNSAIKKATSAYVENAERSKRHLTKIV